MSGRTIAIAGLVAVAIVSLIWFQGFARAAAKRELDTVAPAKETVLAVTPEFGVTDTTGSISLDSAIAADSLLVTPSAAAAALPATTVPATPTLVLPAPQQLPIPVTLKWTKATARTYINVRTGADRKAPVVGVITPNMHVELGARLHGWRQVRASGINGWADPRNFLADSSRF
ncbi:MAG: SH3 domain-containing protein [Gemmatimonadaceae bacterium]